MNPGKVIAALALKCSHEQHATLLFQEAGKMALKILAPPIDLKTARAIFKEMGRTDFELLLEAMDQNHTKKLLKAIDPYSPFLAGFIADDNAAQTARQHIVRLLASKLMKPEPKPAGKTPVKKVPKKSSSEPQNDEIPFPGQQPHAIATKPPHAAITHHLSTLRSAGTDEALFVKALEALRDDKDLAVDSLFAIAHQYIGGRTKWPSRKAALEGIKTRFVERGYQAAKMELLKNFNPW